MEKEFGFASQQNAQDIIGFLHHNISQHTKEIAVINTTLADISKNKIDNNFKSSVVEFMEHTETKVERLSTSFKLLTKQVFHNDASIQNMINSSLEKVTNQTSSGDLEEIKNNQKNILERLDALENAKITKKCELSNTETILIYDSPPEKKKKSLNVNKVVFDHEEINNNEERDKLIESLLQRVDDLEKLRETIRNENQENSKNIGQNMLLSQKSINDMKMLLNVSDKNNKNEIDQIKKRLDTFATKEELNLYLQGSYNIMGRSRGASNGRPSTAFSVNHVERYQTVDQQPPTVSFTMISGDNLTRPSTTQTLRVQSNKRAKARGYR